MRQSLALALLLIVPATSRGQDTCTPQARESVTNHFSFSASSTSGAKGQVVPVELSISVGDHPGRLSMFTLVVSYDSRKAELVGLPVFSRFFEEQVPFPIFARLGGEVGPRSRSGLSGVDLGGGFNQDTGDLLSDGKPRLLATLHFRLLGEPGEVVDLRFADGEFFWEQVSGGVRRILCIKNRLFYYPPSRFADDIWTLSNRHVHGRLLITPGEPTQTEPPPLPPEARIYGDVPPESEGVRFELLGGFGSPGAEVAVPLHVTSAYDFVAYQAVGRFPVEHLELLRIEQHTRPGPVRLDNERGEFTSVSSASRRRLGVEGERIHVATLHFRVKEEAASAAEVTIGLERNRWGVNWVNVLGSADGVEASVNVEPLRVVNAVLALRRVGTVPGDVNLDHALNLSDPIALLGHLFGRGGELACPGAADFNSDDAVDLSDAVAVLDHLFRGGPPSRLGSDVPCAR